MKSSSKFLFGPSILPLASGAIVAGIGFASGGSILSASVAGMATGVSSYAAAALLGKEQETQIKLLEGESEKQKVNKTVIELNAQRVRLERELADLRQQRDNGERLAAEAKGLERQRDLLEQNIQVLQGNQQNLEQRVAAIGQANPNLEALEERQRQIAHLKATVQELQGQKQALTEKIAEMEVHRDRLRETEAIFLQKQAEAQTLAAQVERDAARLTELNQKAAEVELLRSIYDALAAEKANYEARLEHLQAEVPRLEQQRDSVLQEIQQWEERAQETDRLRAIIDDLDAQIRTKQRELGSLKRQIAQLESEQASLEQQVNDKKQEVERLEKKIKELKGEIDRIENDAQQALKALREPIKNIPTTPRSFASERDFFQQFQSYLQAQGLAFPDRTVKAFHTSLKVQDISALVILAGISGTGKSELPRNYARFLGAPLVDLAVQPRWDSPQDLQGFYNYVEKKYKPTELMHYLYQYQHDSKLRGRPILVLLDEMNLARVEYYFSDFLSKLEKRRSEAPLLDLDVGSVGLDDKDKKVRIPDEFLFVGTMNEDETTQSLSDKVLDRANVLTFGRPHELKLRPANKLPTAKPAPTVYLTWDEFSRWVCQPDPSSQLVEEVKDFVDRANEIMEKMGHPFAHRVYQAIAKYVANYPGTNHDESIRKQAIADQFGQKLLPKLRGVILDDNGTHLDDLNRLIDELEDEALQIAFKRAREGRYGQFHWKGIVYS